MKKVALSLAGVLAAVAFAPEASALPVFARQTGMACSACHFQHFPLLNGFGRAFKAGGFTMIGSQNKVEGDNLSIPAELNFAGLASMGYEKSNALPLAGDTAGTPTNPSGAQGLRNTGDGSVYVPGTNGEMSLFFGGRISEYAGFLSEWGAIGAAGLGSAKLPILFDVGDNKVGVVAFTTSGQGASYGFEYLNTGANAIHSITNDTGFQGQFVNAVSAQQYIGTGSNATGAAIVANGSWGFINVTKFHQAGPADLGGTGAMLGSTYLRAAFTFDLAGWDSAVGAQNWSGSSTSTVVPGATAGTTVIDFSETRANAVDFQMQGAVGEMPMGVYVTWANAPVPTAGANSTFNPGGTDAKSAINIAAELGVVPERVTVGAAIRSGKSGQTVNDASGNVLSTNASDNAIMLTTTYKLAQNQVVRLSYVHQSGDYWDGYAAGAATNNSDATGANSYRLSLYSLF